MECRSDTLDLPFLLSRTLLERRGFEEVQPQGQRAWLWLAGAEGSLELPFRTTAAKTARLRARCKVGQGPRLPVVVSLNGHVLTTLTLTPEEAEHAFDVPPSVQVPGRNALRFEARARAPRPRRPMMITGLDVAPAWAPRGAAPSRSADGLWLGGASVRYPLPPERGLELEVALRSASSGEGSLRVDVEGRGPERELSVLAAAAGGERRERVRLPDEDDFARVVLSGTGPAWIPTLKLRVPSPAMRPSPPSSAAVSRQPPNLVLFLADAVRADLLSAYGNPHPTSPRFDTFAREGWLFEDATAQSAWTRPSVASLLTGLGVDAHGVVGLGNTMVPALVTLPEALHAAGYATAAFVANDVLSPALGYSQGFDVWKSLPRRPSAEVVRAVLDWTRGRPGPFFIYIHTLGAHRPYLPAPEHWHPFLPEAPPRAGDVNALVLRPRLTPEELALVRSAYEGEIHEDDAAFGQLLDGLQAQGSGPRTAIAFTADHGEAFDEHGDRGHGIRLYQETAHVPLAVRVPGASGGRRIRTPVQHIDLAPTFLSLAGLAVPPQLLGADLTAIAATGPNEAGGRRLLVSRVTYAGADKVAVRRGSLKLIVNEEPDAPAGGRFELYDLEGDPGEARNLAAGRPQAVEYLWMESRALWSVEEGLRARVGAGRTAPLSREDREALRALGYIH